MRKVLAMIALSGILVACGSTPDARQEYYNNRSYEISPFFVRSIDQADDLYGLRNLYFASLMLEIGNEREALESLRRGCEVADNIDLSSVGVNFIFSAKNRVFTGEPYERSSAHAYRGLLLYREAMRAQDEQSIYNVRASFLKCLDHDKATADVVYQRDWGLAYYMLAKTFLNLKDQGNMESSLAAAREIFKDNPYLENRAVAESNFTLLVGVGPGPYKIQGQGFMGIGANDEIAVVKSPEGDDVRIWIDGKEAGVAAPIVDINVQALHRPSQAAKIAAGAGRVVGKAAVSRIPIFGRLVGAVAFDTSADLKAWDVLPAKIYLFSAKLHPGSHTVAIKFPKQERYNQVHYYLPVRSDQPDNLFYFTSIRNKQNAIVVK